MFPKTSQKEEKPTTSGTKSKRLRDLAEPGGTDVLLFDPRKILVEKDHNPRNFDTPEMRAHLDDIKTSIAANGVLIPLSIRYDAAGDHAILLDGETRLRACLELQAEGSPIKSVPCIQVKGVKSDDEAKRTLYLLQVNSGRPLTQLECGKGYAKLVGLGWAESDIAEQVGQSLRYVNEALQIFDAPKPVQAMVEENQVTLDRAIAEVRKHGSEAASILAPEVAEAEANGTGPVRREKKASPNPYKLMVGKISAEVSQEFKRDAGAKYFRVSAELIRELIAMVEAALPSIPENLVPVP